MLSKIMRNVTVLFISFALVGATLVTAPKAFAEEDIMQYVVSGSGTFEDPYVFGKDNEYKDMFDEMARAQSKATKKTRSQFSASLTGKKNYAPNGGLWNYTYGAPDSISDGMLWYTSIVYTSDKNAISDAFKGLQVREYLDIVIQGLAEDYVGPALNAYLVAHGVPSYLGNAAEKIFVKGFSYFSFSAADKKAMQDSLAVGGMLSVSYRTSYHGSWYTSDVFASWDEIPYACEPGSYYGAGVFTKY